MDRRRENLASCILALATVTGAGCSSPGTTSDDESIRAAAKLTADECTAAAVGGKVEICHATGSATNPYVHIEVATSACINAHARKHAGDFISSDPSCTLCGNGIVEAGETCDPPSSCPTSCDDSNACTVDGMTGSAAGCNAVCEHTAVSTCQSGDGCCASGCNANTDSDCSPSCGNGAVEAGETCDPPSSCPTGCSDGNACTVDQLSGSAADCSAACTFAPYTCADELSCTDDLCNGDGTCSFAIQPGNCVAEGVCHAGGHGPVDPEPADPTSNVPVSISLTSGFLGVDLTWNGRFTIGAYHPSPWDILYGWPGSPWTTSTTVRVDGDDYHFGDFGWDNEFLQYPYAADSVTSVARWRMGMVVVTQTLRIVGSTTTGDPDVVKIQYDLANTDSDPHEVGLRMLMDAEINHNDGAPFRIPGRPNPITTETELLGAQVPQYYQAFFDLSDPVHVVQGTLSGADVTAPDRFAMVSWYNASATYWDYDVTPGMPFGNPAHPDSGVLLYWNPQTVEPGVSRRIVLYYGLGALSGSPTLGLTGPARLRLTDNAWAPNPFTVVAYLKNTDLATRIGEALTLSFAETGGLALAAGETATHSLPAIPPGATIETSWSVVPLATGTWSYGVGVASTPELWAQRSVAVPQPWACVP
jgi:hypothetical protein